MEALLPVPQGGPATPGKGDEAVCGLRRLGVRFLPACICGRQRFTRHILSVIPEHGNREDFKSVLLLLITCEQCGEVIRHAHSTSCDSCALIYGPIEYEYDYDDYLEQYPLETRNTEACLTL